ncbi:MAG TPA: CRISPR-associated endonuclease Cas2 [Chromatiaceae bacterium]|nr:CRISPR-associated endonuclease Cas2 [Chromatiaceae bacterium]
MHEHLYIVSYDISDPKRWWRIFRLMHGYGDWLQLSIFQCRLGEKRRAEMIALIDGIITHGQDHVLILDLGPAEGVKPRITSLGKSFAPVKREPIIA